MTSRLVLARMLSVLGHPAVLMPLAVVGSAVARGAPAQVVQMAALACSLVAIAVGIYSVRQVRAGRWQHVDASLPRERRQLTVFLVFLLSAMAAVLIWVAQPPVVAAGLAIGAGVVAVALLAQRWLKLSLHAAFGAFAACLAWPGVAAFAGLSMLAAGVAWSRLELRRHTRAEVWAGLVLGALAGLLFQGLAAHAGRGKITAAMTERPRPRCDSLDACIPAADPQTRGPAGNPQYREAGCAWSHRVHHLPDAGVADGPGVPVLRGVQKARQYPPQA